MFHGFWHFSRFQCWCNDISVVSCLIALLCILIDSIISSQSYHGASGCVVIWFWIVLRRFHRFMTCYFLSYFDWWTWDMSHLHGVRACRIASSLTVLFWHLGHILTQFVEPFLFLIVLRHFNRILCLFNNILVPFRTFSNLFSVVISVSRCLYLSYRFSWPSSVSLHKFSHDGFPSSFCHPFPFLCFLIFCDIPAFRWSLFDMAIKARQLAEVRRASIGHQVVLSHRFMRYSVHNILSRPTWWVSLCCKGSHRWSTGGSWRALWSSARNRRESLGKTVISFRWTRWSWFAAALQLHWHFLRLLFRRAGYDQRLGNDLKGLVEASIQHGQKILTL